MIPLDQQLSDWIYSRTPAEFGINPFGGTSPEEHRFEVECFFFEAVSISDQQTEFCFQWPTDTFQQRY